MEKFSGIKWFYRQHILSQQFDMQLSRLDLSINTFWLTTPTNIRLSHTVIMMSLRSSNTLLLLKV
jgi:hypothetical protein